MQPFFYVHRWGGYALLLRQAVGRGDSWMKTFRHVLKRSLLLLLMGVGLRCIYSGELRWELWNVLAQLSFTYLVAFVVMRRSV